MINRGFEYNFPCNFSDAETEAYFLGLRESFERQEAAKEGDPEGSSLWSDMEVPADYVTPGKTNDPVPR